MRTTLMLVLVMAAGIARAGNTTQFVLTDEHQDINGELYNVWQMRIANNPNDSILWSHDKRFINLRYNSFGPLRLECRENNHHFL